MFLWDRLLRFDSVLLNMRERHGDAFRIYVSRSSACPTDGSFAAANRGALLRPSLFGEVIVLMGSDRPVD